MNDSEVKRDLERLKRDCEEAERFANHEWRKGVLDLLRYVEDASPEERRSEEFNRLIWSRENPIASMPQGELFNNELNQVVVSDELLSWLANMEPLPDNPERRAEVLDSRLSEAVDLVKHLTGGKRRPAAVTRLLAALFPRDFTSLIASRLLGEFISYFNKKYPTLEIDPDVSDAEKHRQTLKRLDDALGTVPEGDLEERVRRMTLPHQLHELWSEEPRPKPQPADDSGEETTPQNIILYGPPGTGKTYATFRRCVEICDEKGNAEDMSDGEVRRRYGELVAEKRVEFVTFHQSYGYEEFVEGLRPVLDDTEGGDVRYELHAGVFKRIALRSAAEGLQKLAEGPDFDDLWDRLVAEIGDDSDRIVKGKQGNEYVFQLSPRGSGIQTLRCERDEENEEYNVKGTNPLAVSKEKSKRLWDQRNTFGEHPKDLDDKVTEQIFEGVGVHFTALWIVYKRLWELSQESDPSDEERPSDNTVQRALEKGASFSFSTETSQYVLIIDEINRGNVSKILGELITLLEPDKRLTADNELTLKLPYSQAYFGVPPNLHILGTMNTADRSIALIDTALRRRFHFEELPPNPDLLRDDVEGIDLQKVLRAMNDRLEWLVDRDHLIGHAWLMEAETKADVDRVMRLKIIPLIAEYFYDDWEKVRAVLGGTNDFVNREELRPPPGLDDTGEVRYRWTVQEKFEEGAYDRLISGSGQTDAE